MRFARRHALALWLLPLVLCQLLLPPGVMPGSPGGSAGLVLCDGHHGPMAPSGAPDPKHPANPGHGSMCPFAAVGAAAPLPTLPVAALDRARPCADEAPACGQRVPAAGPVRSQRSRAPPTVS